MSVGYHSNQSTYFVEVKWRYFLYFVLVVASATHLYPIWAIPLFGDELGVLLRTNVSGYSELLKQSVIEQDVHPPGVQSLYYLLYGLWHWPLWSLKLLSALAGIGSVGLIALIGKVTGRPKAGIIAAALLAVLQMSLFYSVLIRPYAFGQFFFLIYVLGHYRWVVQGRLTRFRIIVLGLALCIIGSIHYMTLLTAIIFYLVSFTNKNVRTQWKSYLGIAVVGSLLYLPQLPVFIAHLGKGNPGNWLTAPNASFFAEFFGYLVHYSWLFGGALCLVIITSFLLWWRQPIKRTSIYWVGLLVFISVVVINLIYSFWRGPILQFSTLYFALPLLILFLFSMAEVLPTREWLLSGVLILITGITSLVLEREHFELITKSDRTTLNELANTVKPGASFLLQAEVQHNFYHKNGTQPYNIEDWSIADIRNAMLSVSADTIAYGYNLYEKFEIVPWLYDHYGSPIVKENMFNAQWLAFDPRVTATGQNHLFLRDITSRLVPEDSLAEYSPVVTIPYDSLTSHPYNFISLRVKAKGSYSRDSSWVLVVKCVKDRKDIALNIRSASDFISPDETSWAYATFAPFSVPGDKSGSTLEFYLWNPHKQIMNIERAEVLVTEGNRYMYGLLRPIPHH